MAGMEEPAAGVGEERAGFYTVRLLVIESRPIVNQRMRLEDTPSRVIFLKRPCGF
jgi:hypothetical protein